MIKNILTSLNTLLYHPTNSHNSYMFSKNSVLILSLTQWFSNLMNMRIPQELQRSQGQVLPSVLFPGSPGQSDTQQLWELVTFSLPTIWQFTELKNTLESILWMPSLYKEGDRCFAMLSGLSRVVQSAGIWAVTQVTGFCTWLTNVLHPPLCSFGASRCRSVHVTVECWWHEATSSCVWRKCDFPEKSCPSEFLALPYLTTKVLILSDNNVFYVVAPKISI